MKKLRFTLVLATILFAAACHNPNSSTAQEVDDETPAKTEEHGGHSTTGEHKATDANEHETETKDTTAVMDTTTTGDTTTSRPH